MLRCAWRRACPLMAISSTRGTRNSRYRREAGNDETRFRRTQSAGRAWIPERGGLPIQRGLRNANAGTDDVRRLVQQPLVLGKPRQSLHRTGHQWWQRRIGTGRSQRWGRRILQPVLLQCRCIERRTIPVRPAISDFFGRPEDGLDFASDRSVRSTTTTCRCMTTTARSSTASANRIDAKTDRRSSASQQLRTVTSTRNRLCGRRHDAGRHPGSVRRVVQVPTLPATTSPPRSFRLLTQQPIALFRIFDLLDTGVHCVIRQPVLRCTYRSLSSQAKVTEYTLDDLPSIFPTSSRSRATSCRCYRGSHHREDCRRPHEVAHGCHLQHAGDQPTSWVSSATLHILRTRSSRMRRSHDAGDFVDNKIAFDISEEREVGCAATTLI